MAIKRYISVHNNRYQYSQSINVLESEVLPTCVGPSTQNTSTLLVLLILLSVNTAKSSPFLHSTSAHPENNQHWHSGKTSGYICLSFPISSIFFFCSVWSASWGLHSLAKETTNFLAPKCIPQSPKSQVQEANTILAESVIDVWLRVAWSQHILYASEKIISFTLGGACSRFSNHQSWQEPTGSLRDTDGFIHRYKAKTLGMLMSWSCKLWLNPSVVLLHTAWSIIHAVRWSYSIVHPRRKSNPICHCLEINQNWSSF